ncbi:nitrate reductase [Rivibacter subsaxonicus]|uniref:Assimilatory nitrate reductase (NADH) alpha subunit apoprotein n=1 Tax=Rivibacter subsaxonicus TaxID=457575 RepID=A0A4Q7VZJ5_9BURK|nr:nitrate reductase [Rivibacter subsaxonicus]RZU02200.1 assimilatory nitrate reductase (NADH) alpha subunit apoprotein [Rivibacter subsaxonicus]
MAETRSTCPYCGVGCGVLIQSEGNRITGVRGDPDHPANFGRLCSKGSTLHLTATERVLRDERLLRPMLRPQRGGALQPLGWEGASALLADRIDAVLRDKGPQAIAFYLSGQLLTEDYAVFNKLARALVQTNNIDTNSRLCMSSAVAGYKQSLGADAPPACYEDLAHAGCLFIAGANSAWAHPVLFRRIEDARAANPRQKIVVVDPRRTETADEADLHLQLQPGTDVALFHAMLHVMVWEGWLDERFIAEHTGGFAALKSLVAAWTPREAARVCGLKAEQIEQAARWFALGGEGADVRAGGDETTPAARAPTLSLYCQGLNQSTSGTAKNSALINLHLATGQIGKPGAGPLSLTGQPNAMGGREAGGMATLLPGHRDPTDAAHRAEVAAIWGVDALPEQPGLSAVPMFEAAARGEIELLWIACTNPAQSLPDQALVRAALARCPFVVVQEAFARTETTGYADLLLPAATWGEKDGTVTNSERRISRVRAAVPAPGEARGDWQIAAEVARRLEAKLRPGAPSLFDYAGTEAVWNEHRQTTVGRDLDIGGLSWTVLDQRGPQQWPMAAGWSSGRVRLYQDGRFPTPDGRARFIAAPYKPVAEATNAQHPFALNTGRLRDQWHGMSRSGSVPALFAHAPQPALQLHPQDMARRGLREGELAELKSKRGSLVLPVAADTRVAPLQAFVPMHWGSQFVGGTDAKGQSRAGINGLMHGKSCPQSLQPELKHAAINIAPAVLPWRLNAAAWLPAERLAEVRETLIALMPDFAYASCVPVPARAGAEPERIGLQFSAAHATAPDAALVARIEAALGLDRGAMLLRYADARRGHKRTVRLRGEGEAARVDALLLAGPSEAAAWLLRWWAEALPIAEHARALLLPDPQPPGGMTTQRARQVCNCLDISEPQIRSALASIDGNPAERLALLQTQLQCGTQCGSCKPELKRLVGSVPAATPQEIEA